MALGSTAPLTSTMRSQALTSRASPGSWRFHASKEPPATARTTETGSIGRPAWTRRPSGTLGL
eukprot:3902315-Alexandrium_andersonii.AAC.1